MKMAIPCVTHTVATVSGKTWIKFTLDSSPVGLGTIASLKTLSTQISANFDAIGTTMNTNT